MLHSVKNKFKKERGKLPENSPVLTQDQHLKRTLMKEKHSIKGSGRKRKGENMDDTLLKTKRRCVSSIFHFLKTQKGQDKIISEFSMLQIDKSLSLHHDRYWLKSNMRLKMRYLWNTIVARFRMKCARHYLNWN